MTVHVNLNAIPTPGRVMQIEQDLAKMVRVDTDPFVPRLEGDLAGLAKVGMNDGHPAVIYDREYAHYQFIGLTVNNKPFNYTKTFHPLANANWIENSKEANMQRWEQFVEGELTK